MLCLHIRRRLFRLCEAHIAGGVAHQSSSQPLPTEMTHMKVQMALQAHRRFLTSHVSSAVRVGLRSIADFALAVKMAARDHQDRGGAWEEEDEPFASYLTAIARRADTAAVRHTLAIALVSVVAFFCRYKCQCDCVYACIGVYGLSVQSCSSTCLCLFRVVFMSVDFRAGPSRARHDDRRMSSVERRLRGTGYVIASTDCPRAATAGRRTLAVSPASLIMFILDLILLCVSLLTQVPIICLISSRLTLFLLNLAFFVVSNSGWKMDLREAMLHLESVDAHTRAHVDLLRLHLELVSACVAVSRRLGT